jgi:hypothetical protein
MTAAEAYARMTVRQRKSMEWLRKARQDAEVAETLAESAQALVRVQVYDAVEAKIPIRFLAEELGLSQSRIYQIRDEVAAHRQPR